MVYAIVECGGKQHRVQPGARLVVERLPQAEGEQVVLERVLLIADGERVSVGAPTVPGARVRATVLSHGKAPKITVLRYKRKVRYHKKTGHRQPYTTLAIEEIQGAAPA
ncbi:MAG: 50S ribosomal protein L21 [Chloroflexi bacterium]|nr:50S ribosomal protein L21 [Chloroflexota bacterium]